MYSGLNFISCIKELGEKWIINLKASWVQDIEKNFYFCNNDVNIVR